MLANLFIVICSTIKLQSKLLYPYYYLIYYTYVSLDWSCFLLEPVFSLVVNFEFLHFIPFTWYLDNLLLTIGNKLCIFFLFWYTSAVLSGSCNRKCASVVRRLFIYCLTPPKTVHIHTNSCLVLSPCQPFRLL